MDRLSISAVVAGLLFQSAAFAAPNLGATSAATAVAAGPTVEGPVKTVSGTGVTTGPLKFNLNAYNVQVLPLDTAAGMGDGIIVGTVGGVASVYVNGQVIPLPGKTGYSNVQPTAISSNGYIVGFGHSGTNDRGLFWSSYTSAPRDMGGLGAITHPQSVNSSGVAVGEYFSESVYDLPTAFAFSISTGIRSIAPPYSNQSDAYSISDSGFVAGFAWYGDEQAATRWYPGGSFAAGTAAFGNFAWKAMEDGTIFGYTVSWNPSNQATNIAPNNISLVYDISGEGRKVGTNVFASPTRGWTVAAGSNTAEILPVPSGAINTFATQVNGCGTILGYATFSDGSTKALLWSKLTCDFSQLYATSVNQSQLLAQ